MKLAWPRSLLVPKEEDEAKFLMEWAHYRIWHGGRLSKILIAISNGAYLGADPKTRAITMGKLKVRGVRPGVFDYLLPVPCWRLKIPGLWLELKRLRGGEVSQEQKDFEADMIALGWKTQVCKGWVAASEAIDRYLDLCGAPSKPIGNSRGATLSPIRGDSYE
jgi:hypothetical protein